MPTVLARGREGECSEQQSCRVAREGKKGVLPAAKPLPKRERAIYKEGRGGKLRKKGAQREKWETGARVVSVAS